MSSESKSEGAGTVQLWAPADSDSRFYCYDPLPDITLFELAQILPLFAGGLQAHRRSWEQMGTAKRHFKEQP